MKFIDSHTHFHDPSADADLSWPSPDMPYYRTCLPSTYRAEVGSAPVVAVETSPEPQDDYRLQRLAASDPLIAAYVSNLQPLDKGFEARLDHAIRDPKWRGIRLRPIEEFDLTSGRLHAALNLLEGRGHVELGIAHPSRLPQLRSLCLALPRIDFVLTHCGHPKLESTEPAYDYAQFDGLTNLYVKVSPPQGINFEDIETRGLLARHIETLMKTLPPQRLMFGSNWPVAEAPLEFRDWLFERLVDTPQAAEHVFFETARSIYRIDA